MFHARSASPRRAYRPSLLILEDRTLLSTYVVDHLADDLVGSGLNGSLRYCITHAADGDVITFGVTGTINLTSALPSLVHNISIQGPGANLLTVAGSGFFGSTRFSVFTVSAGATVSISGLTVTNGYTRPFGGGIDNAGTLTLSNSTVTGNQVRCDAFCDMVVLAGGGIFNGNDAGTATLTINNSTVSDNAGGIAGGGIANGYLLDGVLVPGGIVTISNSTVSDNGSLYGGGIYSAYADAENRLNVINSSIVDNGANDGGGILNDDGSTLTVTNSTIAGNVAEGLDNAAGGIDTGGETHLRNTIVAGNSASYGPDVAGSLTTSGYNLIGNTFAGSGFDPTDLLNVDPRLGPLQHNGGPTQTMALLRGSPALNAGDPAQLGVADQRGVVRTSGVNIGAYQASASAFVLTAPATVTAGAPFDVTVTTVDPFGQAALGYTGTVTFGTSDPDPGVALPADYTFTASDLGTHTFGGGFTLITPGDQTVTAADGGGGFSGSAVVTVQGGGAAAGGHRASRIWADALLPVGLDPFTLAQLNSRRAVGSHDEVFGKLITDL